LWVSFTLEQQYRIISQNKALRVLKKSFMFGVYARVTVRGALEADRANRNTFSADAFREKWSGLESF